MPELRKEIQRLLLADARFKEWVSSLPQTYSLNISVDSENEDYLGEGLSTLQQIRRQQSKLLARKIYRRVHPDTAKDPLYSLHEIRQYVKAGELEILHLISKEMEIDTAGSIEAVRHSLKARMEKLRATASFKLCRLYAVNRPGFVEEARAILEAKTESLIKRHAESMSGLKAHMEKAGEQDRSES